MGSREQEEVTSTYLLDEVWNVLRLMAGEDPGASFLLPNTLPPDDDWSKEVWEASGGLLSTVLLSDSGDSKDISVSK